jgi:hypothetical protein
MSRIPSYDRSAADDVLLAAYARGKGHRDAVNYAVGPQHHQTLHAMYSWRYETPGLPYDNLVLDGIASRWQRIWRESSEYHAAIAAQDTAAMAEALSIESDAPGTLPAGARYAILLATDDWNLVEQSAHREDREATSRWEPEWARYSRLAAASERPAVRALLRREDSREPQKAAQIARWLFDTYRRDRSDRDALWSLLVTIPVPPSILSEIVTDVQTATRENGDLWVSHPEAFLGATAKFQPGFSAQTLDWLASNGTVSVQAAVATHQSTGHDTLVRLIEPTLTKAPSRDPRGRAVWAVALDAMKNPNLDPEWILARLNGRIRAAARTRLIEGALEAARSSVLPSLPFDSEHNPRPAIYQVSRVPVYAEIAALSDRPSWVAGRLRLLPDDLAAMALDALASSPYESGREIASAIVMDAALS